MERGRTRERCCSGIRSSVEHKRKQWESRYAKLDSTYLKDSEARAKSQLDAVKGKLAAAIEGGDTAKQVEAQAELAL